VVICLERGADLHTAQLMPLPFTVSCFSKIQIGLTFLVPAHPCGPGQRGYTGVCLSVLSYFMMSSKDHSCSEIAYHVSVSVYLDNVFEFDIAHCGHCHVQSHRKFQHQTNVALMHEIVLLFVFIFL